MDRALINGVGAGCRWSVVSGRSGNGRVRAASRCRRSSP